MFLDRLFHRRDDTAALRDELIIERTARVFAEAMLRPKREVRRDAGSYQSKKDETTAALLRLYPHVARSIRGREAGN